MSSSCYLGMDNKAPNLDFLLLVFVKLLALLNIRNAPSAAFVKLFYISVIGLQWMLNYQVKITQQNAISWSGDVTISGLSFIDMFDQTNMINLNIKVCRFFSLSAQSTIQ